MRMIMTHDWSPLALAFGMIKSHLVSHQHKEHTGVDARAHTHTHTHTHSHVCKWGVQQGSVLAVRCNTTVPNGSLWIYFSVLFGFQYQEANLVTFFCEAAIFSSILPLRQQVRVQSLQDARGRCSPGHLTNLDLHCGKYFHKQILSLIKIKKEKQTNQIEGKA